MTHPGPVGQREAEGARQAARRIMDHTTSCSNSYLHHSERRIRIDKWQHLGRRQRRISGIPDFYIKSSEKECLSKWHVIKFPQKWRMLGGGDMTGKHDLALSRNIKTRTKCRVLPLHNPRINRQGEFEYETISTRIELLVFQHWGSGNMRSWRTQGPQTMKSWHTELGLKFKTKTTVWIVNLDSNFLRLALHLLMRLKPLCLIGRQEVFKRSKIERRNIWC